MKNGLIAILAAFLLSACGNSQQMSNVVNPATGWANWNKTSAAVYTGPSRIVSDPSVLPDESLFRMAYTSVDFANVNGPHASISLATSGDSLSWGVAANTTGTTFRGEVLRGRAGQWDENLETPFLLKTQSGYLLYYSGYRDGVQPGSPGKGFPASLGVARLADGVN